MTRSAMTLITAAAFLLAAVGAQAAYNYKARIHGVGPAPGAIGIVVTPGATRPGLHADPSFHTGARNWRR
jgi:hypothetical protein